MENRLFEWVMTGALLGQGLTMLVWPIAIEVGLFRYILLVAEPDILATIYLLLGIFRSVSLVIDRRFLKWGPRLRAIGASGAALLWLQMTASLVQVVPLQLAPSISIAVYFSLAVGEFYAMFRAVKDHV